jgi:tagatose 6-phosphate kinase
MILSLGMTPALQRTLLFQSIEFNEVNRAAEVMESAAGKSLNVAHALAILGGRSALSGFNGGHNGETITRLLQQYGVESVMTATLAETRICTTLINLQNGDVTELVEEAPQPSAAEIRDFVDTNLELIRKCEMLVISGTLPPYAGHDFYRQFTTAAARCDVPVVIDSHREALLGVLADRPLVTKLNLRELEKTFNLKIENDDSIRSCLFKLIELGAQNVFMTQGGKNAWIVTPQRVEKLKPPAIAVHKNPIGSGDCTTAGLASKLIDGFSLTDSARFGLACGSANVESYLPADFERRRAVELSEQL